MLLITGKVLQRQKGGTNKVKSEVGGQYTSIFNNFPQIAKTSKNPMLQSLCCESFCSKMLVDLKYQLTSKQKLNEPPLFSGGSGNPSDVGSGWISLLSNNSSARVKGLQAGITQGLVE